MAWQKGILLVVVLVFLLSMGSAVSAGGPRVSPDRPHNCFVYDPDLGTMRWTPCQFLFLHLCTKVYR